MKLSCAESRRVLDFMRLEKDPRVDWGSVLLAVTAAGFATEHQDVLVDAVTARMLAIDESEPAPPAAKISRTSTQNFESWTSFVPQAVWTAVLSGSMDEIFDHLGKLGLRSPSEQTSAVMSLVILHATDGYERAQAMSPETRMQFLKSVKHAFKHRSKRWPAPESYVVTLPETPLGFANQFPSMHTRAFADGAPVASPISEAELLQLRATTQMRGSRVKPAPTLQIGSPSSSNITQADLFSFGQGIMAMMSGQSQPEPLLLQFKPKQKLQLTLPMKLLPSASPALRPEEKEPAEAAEAAEAALAAEAVESAALPSDVDKVSAAIDRALEEAAAKGKKAKSPKAKGKSKAKAASKDAAKAKAKAEAASTSLTKAKPVKAADFKSHPMPKLEKIPPIFLGSCTIYTDVGRRLWRAVEASNRRYDVKFPWKCGAVTKENWHKCVQWCHDNST